VSVELAVTLAALGNRRLHRGAVIGALVGEKCHRNVSPQFLRHAYSLVVAICLVARIKGTGYFSVSKFREQRSKRSMEELPVPFSFVSFGSGCRNHLTIDFRLGPDYASTIRRRY
jgi:hypothetical protein